MEEAATVSDAPDSRVWKVAAVAFLGPFISQLDSTVVNVSLSSIRQELHSTLATAQWIVSGYLLALALMLPLNGWLVDRVGAKRLYLGCFSAFTVASILCGTAQTMHELIAARLFQGVTGGLLAPMAQLMIARVAGKQMARVMGYTAVPILLAPILGPVVAGAILKYAHWPWLFFLNVPIGIFAIGLAAVLLPRDDAAPQKRPFDFPGFLLISPGLACVVYGLERTAAHRDGSLILLTGVALMLVFVVHALRKGSWALIDLRLFNNRVFSAGAATQFLANGMNYAGQFLIPLYLTTGCGLTAAHAGWLLAPMGIGMLCTYPLMGYLTERFGCRAVSTGGALLALTGTLPFLWMLHNGFSSALTLVCLFARGAGQGAIGIPSASAAYASVPRHKLPTATTAINIVQRMGGPLATTLIAIAMSLSAAPLPASGGHDFTAAFVMLIGLQIIAIASATRLPMLIHQMNGDEQG